MESQGQAKPAKPPGSEGNFCQRQWGGREQEEDKKLGKKEKTWVGHFTERSELESTLGVVRGCDLGVRQKERSIHRGRENREQGGIQSLAAGEDQCKGRDRGAADEDFLHCIPWRR